MKCEVSQTNYVGENWEFAYLMIEWYHTWNSGHARHRFWYTEKMLNKKCSGLLTILFFSPFICIIGYKHRKIHKILIAWNKFEFAAIIFKGLNKMFKAFINV